MAGFAPEDGPPVHDAALDAVVAQWVALAPDSIDVEGALARVNARREIVSSSMPVIDDLATRRARRDAVRPSPVWQRPAFRAAALRRDDHRPR